jgi:hypothetical protein
MVCVILVEYEFVLTLAFLLFLSLGYLRLLLSAGNVEDYVSGFDDF